MLAFYERAQELSLIHFIDANPSKLEVPKGIQQLISAIKIVKELPVQESLEPESIIETDVLVVKVLELKAAIDRLEEEQRMIDLEMARIDAFGQFSLGDTKFIESKTGRVIQYFFSKKGIKDEMALPQELIYISSKYDLDYFISFGNEKLQIDKMIEMSIEHDLGELKKRREKVRTEIHEKGETLKTYARFNEFFHHVLIEKYNDYNLETAKTYAKETFDGKLFAVQGFVPKDKIQHLKEALLYCDIVVSEIAIEPGETPPTYLENKGIFKMGEDLVHVYDTPSNTDKDPSLWVLLSFATFFSMIINDAGYGLIFLLSAFYYRFKNRNLSKAGARVWKLSVLLFSFCLIWGVLTNSFFAMSFGMDSKIRQFSALSFLSHAKAEYHFIKKDEIYEDWVSRYPELEKATTPQEFLRGAVTKNDGHISYDMMDDFGDAFLLEIALLVGIIHICLSFIRYLGRNWQGVGWIIAIIGSYFYFPQFLKTTTIMNTLFGFDQNLLADLGKQMLWIGLTLAILLAVIKNKLLGILEVMNVIQIFADVLSYLRLYALGLAGAVIGATVNEIAGSIFFLGGVALVIIGHGLNMILAVTGGIIHGLRLNFIEWYHYSFEGGGKSFNPLRKIEIE